MRRLYADISPGIGWIGREPEALEAATASQATPRTVTEFLAAGVAALAEHPRPVTFVVAGTTPAHAPTTAVATYTDDGDVERTETVALLIPTARNGGAAATSRAVKTIAQVAYPAGSGVGATVSIGLGLIPGVADLRVIPIEIWLEAFNDRQRPGLLSVIQMDEIIVVGSSFVDEGLGEPHGTYPIPFDLPPPGGVARIARDRCLAEASKLRPAIFEDTLDAMQLLKDATRERDLLRKAHTGTGAAPPDPGANVGGAVYPSPSCPKNKPKFVGANKWGLF